MTIDEAAKVAELHRLFEIVNSVLSVLGESSSIITISTAASRDYYPGNTHGITSSRIKNKISDALFELSSELKDELEKIKNE